LTGSRASPVAGPARVRSWPGTGSAGTRRRLCLWANCAFEQRFLAHSPSGPGSARPRPGGTPLAPRPPLDAADLGHSPRCAVPARSFCTRWRPFSRLFGAWVAARLGRVAALFFTRLREPGQRSRPTREASLGLGLPSALSGDRSVGLPVTRRTRWGGWHRARSRQIWRSPGTAPAAGSLGLTGPPDSLGEASLRRGTCRRGRRGSSSPKLGTLQNVAALTLDGELNWGLIHVN